MVAQGTTAVAEFYEIREGDVNRRVVQDFGGSWSVSHLTDCIAPADVGRKIYREGDWLWMESVRDFQDRKLRVGA